MFGYIVYNRNDLSKEGKAIYHSYYCGLCHSLNQKYGSIGRKTLSYDLTFISMLLSSVYKPENTITKEKCPTHIRKQETLSNEIMDYCADMNIILSYYNFLDDYNDDQDQKALQKANELDPFIDTLKEKYADKFRIITSCLSDLKLMEDNNELNPDIPANCFGTLFSTIFDYKDGEYTETLKSFGYHLGRYIYLLDAAIDIKDDIKNELYNPLITVSSRNFKTILELILAECSEQYEKLPIVDNKEIMDNILYSGIWTAFELKYSKRKEGKL